MSAKNSADADPARKMPVLYFAAFSGPAMSAYNLRINRQRIYQSAELRPCARQSGVNDLEGEAGGPNDA